MLFIEIALIRWVSTEARIFAYVHNLVLLSCFLGIGLGCYRAHSRIHLWKTPAALTALVLLVRLPLEFEIGNRQFHLVRDTTAMLSAFTDSLIWYEPASGSVLWLTALGLSATIVVFLLILVAFIPLGQILAKLLDDHPNTIAAYSWNVVASIAGIWAFAALSFVSMPPWVWFVAAYTGIAALLVLSMGMRTRQLLLTFGLLSVVVVAIFWSQSNNESIETIWSPYQKLEVEPLASQRGIDQGYLVNVNNVGYMAMLDLSDRFVNQFPNVYDLSGRRCSQYDIPYQFHPSSERALILGAGAGNDAAGALRNNIQEVDAIEIDPGIYALGLRLHPEKPYSDTRVNVIIDDARSFMKRCQKTYDVVSFGLLDAHTLSSSYNNLRIDHYVYTVESFREAMALLNDNGILTVSFESQRPWIKQRIHDILWKVAGFPPLTIEYAHNRYGWGGTMFVSGLDSTRVYDAPKINRELWNFVTPRTRDLTGDRSTLDPVPVKLTSDNWPYLYLETPSIPTMHLSIILILTILIVASKKMILKRSARLDMHFFFLGAAFLLLEFQNISKSSLIFGSTWLVNAIMITAILILILLANLIVARLRPVGNNLLYGLLIASSMIAYFLPVSAFNSLDYWSKAILVSAILNLPILFAGIIFIKSFERTPAKDLAFGSNLLGAATGGLLESLSFLIGIHELLLVALGLYIMSWVFLRQKRTLSPG